ncbi:formyltransferase domain-containing protein [Duganella sp. CY15W]|uniref:formyltransferase family protein n=1 Tax=Duganella sp. CY15W TaxID=2692172 RepID=UPI00136BAD0C|nr:formyltransferase family protein [Duganella sp. CY15W]MYM32076.1 formyltransferase domain-containing protein [Duganella sp. CY15W]
MAPVSALTRIAVFGSFHRGFQVLGELLSGPLSQRVQVVGVATDDASADFISRGRRVWSYPHTDSEALMVERLAQSRGLSVYKGRVKSEAFYQLYEQQWRPDICIAATFGQRIDARLFALPRMGFFNLHPCIDDGWPSRYAGPNPFQALMDNGADHVVIALHEVDDGFDTGRLVALSDKVYIPPGASVVDLHKLTSPLAAKFFARELGKMLP